MEARKLAETTIDGEYEIQKWHKIAVDINEKRLRELCDIWDDTEEAYSIGIAIDGEGFLVYMDVDKVIQGIDDRLEEIERDEREYDLLIEMEKKLEAYKGYTIWF